MKQKSVIICDLGQPEIREVLDLLITQIAALQGLKDLSGEKPFDAQINRYRRIYEALQNAQVIYGEGDE